MFQKTDDSQKGSPNYFVISTKYQKSIEVKVWGESVSNPGVYKIPVGMRFIELITYVGGLGERAKLDEIRIIRMKNDSLGITENRFILIDYKDFLKDDTTNFNEINNPVLLPNDIIIIPSETGWDFKDYALLSLNVITSLGGLIFIIRSLLGK